MSLIARVARSTALIIERDLNQQEIADVNEFIKKNIQYIEHSSDVELVAQLARGYADLVEPENKQYISRNDLNLVEFLKSNNLHDFAQAINPEATKRYAHICLDSRYASFNPECTKLSWTISNVLTDAGDAATVLGNIGNITSMKLHSVVVRKFTSTMERATILIEELSEQSFIMPSNRRFHFMGLLKNLQQPISYNDRSAPPAGSLQIPEFTTHDKYEIVADHRFNDGKYRFALPIRVLNNITISIGNPDQLVVIPKYEFTNVDVVDVTSLWIDLELNENHYYTQQWYSVFIDGFLSVSDTFDAWVNNREFTDVLITGPTTIRLYYNDVPAGYHATDISHTGTFAFRGDFPIFDSWELRAVRFNSYRVIFNLELEYQKGS